MKAGEALAWHQFLRFVVVGVLNTAFGYFLFWLLLRIGLATPLALLGATVGGVLFNVLTVGRMVFMTASPLRRLPRFIGVYAVVYGLNLALLEAGERVFRLGPQVAQVFCLPVVVAVSFLLLRTFVYPESKVWLHERRECG